MQENMENCRMKFAQRVMLLQAWARGGQAGASEVRPPLLQPLLPVYEKFARRHCPTALRVVLAEVGTRQCCRSVARGRDSAICSADAGKGAFTYC